MENGSPLEPQGRKHDGARRPLFVESSASLGVYVDILIELSILQWICALWLPRAIPKSQQANRWYRVWFDENPKQIAYKDGVPHLDRERALSKESLIVEVL